MNSGPIPQKTVDKIMSLCGYYCCKCRRGRSYEIHHLDKNPDHHDEDNLMPICPNCHREIGCDKPDCTVQNKNAPFARKYTAVALKKIRDDWYKIYGSLGEDVQIRGEGEDIELSISERFDQFEERLKRLEND
mgnify:CR=1 FL=1